MSDIVVTRNEVESRFEAHRDDRLLGFIEYTLDGTTMDMPHTSVSPDFEGQGIGSTLARKTFDLVREINPDLRVNPTCDFLDVWITRHPDYEDLRA